MIEKNIIHDTSPFDSVDLLTCPLCRFSLRSCQVCSATVACSNHNCAGSQVIECKQCDDHDHMTCQECLDFKEHDAVPTFVQCPTCNAWWCSHRVSWCPGRIIQPTLLGNDLVKLSQQRYFDSSSIVRSHSPMPSPCQYCIYYGHADAWKTCGIRLTALCPSNAHPLPGCSLDGAYCPECITEDNGRHYACGAYWLCATCSVADSRDYPRLISCPRCGTLYCTTAAGCQYCYFCQTCQRTGICFGCQAREKEGEGGEDASNKEPVPLTVFKECLECRWYICNECCSTGKDGAVQCSGCSYWMCGDCASGRTRCFECS